MPLATNFKRPWKCIHEENPQNVQINSVSPLKLHVFSNISQQWASAQSICHASAQNTTLDKILNWQVLSM